MRGHDTLQTPLETSTELYTKATETAIALWAIWMTCTLKSTATVQEAVLSQHHTAPETSAETQNDLEYLLDEHEFMCPDGRLVTVRPHRPGDEDQLRALYTELCETPEFKENRFFSSGLSTEYAVNDMVDRSPIGQPNPRKHTDPSYYHGFVAVDETGKIVANVIYAEYDPGEYPSDVELSIDIAPDRRRGHSSTSPDQVSLADHMMACAIYAADLDPHSSHVQHAIVASRNKRAVRVIQNAARYLGEHGAPLKVEDRVAGFGDELPWGDHDVTIRRQDTTPSTESDPDMSHPRS